MNTLYFFAQLLFNFLRGVNPKLFLVPTHATSPKGTQITTIIIIFSRIAVGHRLKVNFQHGFSLCLIITFYLAPTESTFDDNHEDDDNGDATRS